MELVKNTHDMVRINLVETEFPTVKIIFYGLQAVNCASLHLP